MHFNSEQCCQAPLKYDLCLICQIETGEKLTVEPKSSSYAIIILNTLGMLRNYKDKQLLLLSSKLINESEESLTTTVCNVAYLMLQSPFIFKTSTSSTLS